MKKSGIFRQSMTMIIKILVAFIFVFILYFISYAVNNFTYDYFIFPLLSIIIIFSCGVNVGKCLERMRTKQENVTAIENNKKTTEFIIQERKTIITDKKVMKEEDIEEKIHKKIYNYDNIVNDENLNERE